MEKTSIISNVGIIDRPNASTLIKLSLTDGSSLLRSEELFNHDLRCSGLSLSDELSATRRGFKSITYPEIAGMVVSGDWSAHKAGEEFTDRNGEIRQYSKDGYGVDGFLTLSLPQE